MQKYSNITGNDIVEIDLSSLGDNSKVYDLSTKAVRVPKRKYSN